MVGTRVGMLRAWSLRALRSLVVVLLPGTLATAITIGAVQAYVLTGWRQGTITPLVVCNSNTYAVDSSAWADALSYWYNTPTPFTYQQNCNAAVASLSDIYQSGVAWDGVTAIYGSGGLISYSASYINDWNTGGYGWAERDSVASHELGHVLGLGEQSGYAIMNPVTCGAYSRFCYYTIWGPQTDDINGVNAIY